MTTTPEGQAAPAGADGDVLRVEHISKRYGAVTALIDINMHLRRGEVLGLIGDNGAGKSTLLKILCGFQPPTSGHIFLEGEEITLKSVDQARSLGIDAVYQDLALVNQLTVYHNMFLNRERVRWPLLNNRSMRKEARKRLDAMGLKIPNVSAEVAKLSGGQRQAIAVARSVYSNPKVLLLDEPLAAMGVKEGAIILDLVRELKEQGNVSIGGLVRPDADVVGLLLQFDPVPDAEAPGHRARELNPARAVQRRVLACVLCGLALLVGGRVPYRLAARLAVPHRDRPADLRRHGRVVGDHQHRGAELGVGGLQGGEHVPGGRGVQLAGGLVGQQHLRLVRERRGDGGALLLTAGHAVRGPVGAVRDAQGVEQETGAPPLLAAAERAQPHGQEHVLPGGHVGQQVPRRLLPDEAGDAPPVGQPLFGRHRAQVAASHPHRPRRRRVQPGEDVHQRGFAAARRADQRGQLPLGDQQIQSLQSLYFDALAGVDPDQPVTDDHPVRPGGGLVLRDRRGRLGHVPGPPSSLIRSALALPRW